MSGYARKIETKQHPKIVALYAHQSAAEIAARYSVTAPAIIKILRKNGAVIRKSWKKVPRKNGKQ